MWNSAPKLLGNLEKGRLFILSAPAGTGKTTLTQRLVEEFPVIVQGLSFTTRKPREGEQEGVHYRFISRQEFENKISEGEFLEYAQIYGNYYGTSRTWVEARLLEGKYVVLVIDTQGALQLKGQYPATFIFIMPPSFEALRQRLLERRTESEERIQDRLVWAKKEIQLSEEYDYRFVNDDLEIAYEVLRSIFISEEYKNLKTGSKNLT